MQRKIKCSLLSDRKITLKEKGVIHLVEIDNITHILCQGYLSTVYTTNNGNITVSKLLKQFEEELSNMGFMRINHNAIVNCLYVDKIKRGTKRTITLSNNHVEIKISRRKT